MSADFLVSTGAAFLLFFIFLSYQERILRFFSNILLFGVGNTINLCKINSRVSLLSLHFVFKNMQLSYSPPVSFDESIVPGNCVHYLTIFFTFSNDFMKKKKKTTKDLFNTKQSKQGHRIIKFVFFNINPPAHSQINGKSLDSQPA